MNEVSPQHQLINSAWETLQSWGVAWVMVGAALLKAAAENKIYILIDNGTSG
jgi:hypothetical protein